MMQKELPNKRQKQCKAIKVAEHAGPLIIWFVTYNSLLKLAAKCTCDKIFNSGLKRLRRDTNVKSKFLNLNTM